MTLFRSIPSVILPVLLLTLAACSHRTPEATVEVIDTSLSITPRAEKAALDAVQNQIAHMQRGDTLIVIPITGDAANDSGGTFCASPLQPSARPTIPTCVAFTSRPRSTCCVGRITRSTPVPDRHPRRTRRRPAGTRPAAQTIQSQAHRRERLSRRRWHLPLRLGRRVGDSGTRPPVWHATSRATWIQDAPCTSLSRSP